MVSENIINLLDEFRGLKDFKIAIFATYSFDPLFFEHILLRTLRRNNPHLKIMVLVDAEHYPKISEMTFSTGIDYALVPVSGNLFHPKIFLFLSEENGLAFIGSHNLTFSGITHNLELDFKSKDMQIILDCINFFLDLLGRMFDKNNLIDQLQSLSEKFKVNSLTKQNARFIHNLKEPILGSALGLISQDGPFKSATIYAPFFSNEAELISQIIDKTKINHVDICIQRNNHNLNVDRILHIPSISLKEIISDRMIHSKFIIFRGQKNFALVGSPNFTNPALNCTIENGNSEVAILLELGNKASLFDELSFIDITENDVRNTARNEDFHPDSIQDYELIIRMATLDIFNQLIVQYDRIAESKDLQLVVGYINDKQIIESKQNKLKVVLEANSNSKIISVGTHEASLVWFENQQGTRISNYIRIYRSSSLEHYYGINQDAETLPTLISNVRSIEHLYQFIQALMPQTEITIGANGSSKSNIREPSPGQAPKTARSETIYDMLLDIIRLPRKTRKEKPDNLLVDPPTHLDGFVEIREFDYKQFQRLFDRWTISFEAKKLSTDNSLLNYWLYLLISIKLYDFLMEDQKQRLTFLVRLEQTLRALLKKYNFSEKNSKEMSLFISVLLYLENETNTQDQMQNKDIFKKIVTESTYDAFQNLDSNEISDKWTKLGLISTNAKGATLLLNALSSLLVFKIQKEDEKNSWIFYQYMIEEIASAENSDQDALFVSCVLRELFFGSSENDKRRLRTEIEKKMTSQRSLRYPRKMMFGDVIRTNI